MSHLLGRSGESRATASLGRYRARDGSAGAPVELDIDRPHAALVVGKRGYGKSYTLGVLAESLAVAAGVAPVVVDPMGVFGTLAAADSVSHRAAPTVPPSALAPRSWCSLLDLDATSAPGALLWRAAAAADTLAGMRDAVADADAARSTRRTVRNHLDLADSWGVFDPDGVSARALAAAPATVLDLSGYDRRAMNAVVRAVADSLYERCVRSAETNLPWLLVDEAHVFFDGVAGPALETLLARGRQPGVSLVAATQRPSALPDLAVSQADLLIAHRLTARADLDALARARPTYLDASLGARMPTAPGAALVVDDTTESVHTVRVRERRTPHDGASPRASDRATTPSQRESS